MNKIVSFESIITYLICYDDLKNEVNDQILLNKIDAVIQFSFNDYCYYQFQIISIMLDQIFRNPNIKLNKRFYDFTKSYMNVKLF